MWPVVPLTGNDVCLSDNTFVSGCHCIIERDTETGTVWLQDTRSDNNCNLMTILTMLISVTLSIFDCPVLANS